MFGKVFKVFLILNLLAVFKCNAYERIFYEDAETTSFNEHFLEKNYGTGTLDYWDIFKDSMIRSTVAPHQGNASIAVDKWAVGNPHAVVGYAGATYGNTSNFALGNIPGRYWYFRWYQKYQTGIDYGSSGQDKMFYLNYMSGQGDFVIMLQHNCPECFHIEIKHQEPTYDYVSGGDNWVRSPVGSIDDNQWHFFEVYIDVGTTGSSNAIFLFKVDGQTALLKQNFAYNPTITSTPMEYITGWPANVAPTIGGGSCWTWYDDIEIYLVDGPEDIPPPLTGSEPVDSVPPGDVTNFTAQVGDGQIALSWTNPTDSDFSGTMIRYSTASDPYPVTQVDGTLVCNKTAAPGSNDGCTASGLQNGVPYNFSAFTYDVSGNYSQTAHVTAIPIAETSGAVTTQVWDASVQTGDLTWSDSGVVWTARVLVQGSAITSVPGANMVTLGFQGRASADYQVSKISIAEKDPNVAEADVVDSTWAKVTFDGNSVSSWGTDRMTVPLGMEKLTDAIPFVVEPGKDYYVTFQMNSPSTYLYAPLGYRELYFDSTDMAERAEDVDWSGNGYSVYAQRVHAVSAIYVSTADIVIQPVKDFRLGQ